MMALRIAMLVHRFGITPDQAAMLAGFIWGAGHE